MDDKEEKSPLLQYIVKNPEAFAMNVAHMVEEAGKAMAAYIEPREKGDKTTELSEEMTEVFKTLSQVGEYWISDPARAVEAQKKLWTGYMDIWNRTLLRMGGETVPPAVEPRKGDRRFQDEEWDENQFFDFLKQVYLVTAEWADEMVTDAEGLDAHTKHKAAFYTKQIANALSPSNFLLTNPMLLRETVEANGENLVRGMRMLAEDIKAGDGDLKIRQSDVQRFSVGENLAVTPGKVIWQSAVCQLIQYAPATETVLKRPVLFVPPWINKFYILDLAPGKSLIEWLVAQGHTVFVISWVNPDERHADMSFSEYIHDGIFGALDMVRKATGERQVNAVGYCVGGTLLSVALALMAQEDDDRIASATFFTTQVDFTFAGDLKVFVDDEQVRILEERMADKGYLEGKKMANAFNLLRSNDLVWPYVINNYLRGKEPFPFDLLYWNSDSTRMPAKNHSFYLRNCYLENNLTAGRMEIDGHRLDLSAVKIPIYNLATREDHIAPARSVFHGSQFFGGEVTYVLAGSGHIAGVVNHPTKNKYQFWTGGPPIGDFDAWLVEAEETPGSWWPHWDAWLRRQEGAEVKARKPGARRVKVLENAPGAYVKERA
ncbi:MAG: class I poly(R)-hydroxyalkanoic acid synthase [Pseudomonadota bacterium]